MQFRNRNAVAQGEDHRGERGCEAAGTRLWELSGWLRPLGYLLWPTFFVSPNPRLSSKKEGRLTVEEVQALLHHLRLSSLKGLELRLFCLRQDEQMSSFKEARQRFSRFFFRFRDGESAADVYDRVTTFRET